MHVPSIVVRMAKNILYILRQLLYDRFITKNAKSLTIALKTIGPRDFAYYDNYFDYYYYDFV
jgi:hypothetical protein